LGGFFAVMAFTVGANLMLKLGAGDPEAHRMFGLLSWKSAAGLALFGCGGIVYAFLLRQVPLNIAQVFTSAQFCRGRCRCEPGTGRTDFRRALAGNCVHQLRDHPGRPYSQYLRAVW
jgi:hypothetical protein